MYDEFIENYAYEFINAKDDEEREQLFLVIIYMMLQFYQEEIISFAKKYKLEITIEDLEELNNEEFILNYQSYLTDILIGIYEDMKARQEQGKQDIYTYVVNRIKTMFKTEYENMTQTGQLTAIYIYSQMNNDFMIYKTWVTSGDNLVCPMCRELEGTRLPYDEPFLVNGQVIEGTDGKPSVYSYMPRYAALAHPNCRCHIEFEIEV